MPFFLYHPSYELKWGDHVLPVHKYRLVYERLVGEGIVRAEEFVEPPGVTDEELLLAHESGYLERLEALIDKPMLAYFEFEAPINRDVAAAVRFATGGTILACELALSHKTAALNLGGGFHHAFPDHGEGFCFINDVAVAIRVMQARGLGKRFAVIDCDLHQGNGTAAILGRDPDIFTFSIHQEELYPVPKQHSTLDIGLEKFASDEVYNGHLERHVPSIYESHRPDLVLYVAGADPFEEDQLGDLRLTKAGLRRRDEIVLGTAKAMGIPVAAVLAGGYAPRTEDVVDIHVNMARVIRQVWG